MINSVSNTTSSTNTSSTSQSSATLSENFDTFLTLLTTQLTNQDPMNPMGVSEFTQQLTEFASIEQSIRQTEQGQKQLDLQQSSLAVQYLSLVGQKVSFEGKTAYSDGDGATWKVNVGSDASNSRIIVEDSEGNEIYSQDTNFTAGENQFTWDGYTNSGSKAPAGNYDLTVQAKTSQGDSVSSSLIASGNVEGVDLSGTEPLLTIGDFRYPLSSILSFGNI